MNYRKMRSRAEMDRQRQLHADGLCIRCRRPNDRDRLHCAKCAKKRARYDRNRKRTLTSRRPAA